MITRPSENLTSTELLEKAKSALTPEQYARMEASASEKIGILKLASMNMDQLKAELPKVVAGDSEESDIMLRLE